MNVFSDRQLLFRADGRLLHMVSQLKVKLCCPVDFCTLKPCSDTQICRPTSRTDMSGRQIGANKYVLSYNAVHTCRHVGMTMMTCWPKSWTDKFTIITPTCRQSTLSLSQSRRKP